MLTTSTSARPRVLGSIRNAAPRDAAAIALLLAAAHVDHRAIDAELEGKSEHGHLLVLDLDGEVGAVAQVAIDAKAGHARLVLLIIDASLARTAGREVEERMIGVALALCEAFGCDDVDVVGRPAQILRS